MRVKLFAMILFLLTISASFAGEGPEESSQPFHGLKWKWNGDLQLTGEGRVLNQTALSDLDSCGDFFFRGGVENVTRASKFELHVKPEIRAVVSRGISRDEKDPAHLSAAASTRYLKLQSTPLRKGDSEWVLDLDRLDLSFREESLEIYAGRRPIGLGVLRILPIWNKFTLALPTLGGPRWIFNPDGFGARTQLGDFSLRLLDLEGPTGADGVHLGEMAWFQSGLDLYLLGGRWWQESVLGLAGSMDVGGATLRVEILNVGLGTSSTEAQGQYGLGFERALDDQWTVLIEGVYFSKGVHQTGDYSLQPPSRFMSLRAFGYGLLRVEWQPLPLLKTGAGTLVNLLDGSRLLQLNGTYSLGDNLELLAELSLPWGGNQTEFSGRTFTFPWGATLGMPSQGMLTLKSYF